MSRLCGSIALGSLAVLFILVATPAFSQTVSLYRGTLAIGFGDPENQPGGSRVTPIGTLTPDLANNGVPACANGGFTFMGVPGSFLPSTIATVPVAGYAVQGTGTPASVMFEGYAPIDFENETGGGQAPITSGGCRIIFPPFLAGQLRSRVQFGSQVWPGNALNAAQTTVTGPAGGTLAAGGGNATSTQFSPLNFYKTGMSGMQTIMPGSNMFGGGVPVNGNGDVQLGVNQMPFTQNDHRLWTFGVRNYVEGFLPTGPAVYGTDATNAQVPVGVRASNAYTWRARTPGPFSQGPHQTPGQVGLPFTTNFGWSQGDLQTLGGGTNLSTMGDFAGIFQKWTTGAVGHTDMSGMYTTLRAATGHDWTTAEFTANGTSGPNGTTRKLQLVTPWSASIQKRGDAPFAGLLSDIPDFGFGGVAVLTMDIIPAPEPGTLSMLGFGAAGLIGLTAMRRRKD